jgi:hypothetical protein
MKSNNEGQRWVLLGTSPTSKKVWGLNEINFPCGYVMHAGAYAPLGAPLERPGPGEVWILGGIAFELAEGGKQIPVENATQHLAGYRPWVCVFHHVLLDELNQRGHTIQMWDRGISIFHGLWRQSCQMLGELISVSEFTGMQHEAAEIELSGKIIKGDIPGAYQQKAPDIINFMSQFMTLSPGDLWVKGPLVAERLPRDVNQIIFRVGKLMVQAEVL